jgi:hypothetical protein
VAQYKPRYNEHTLLEPTMRPFGTLIDKSLKFREPSIPGGRMERVQPPAVSRLDEGITELFDYACIANDLETAADLVSLVEKLHARRPYRDEQQRHVGAIGLKRMHGELERRRIMRDFRPAAIGRRPNQATA